MYWFALSLMWHNLRNGVTYHKPVVVQAPDKYQAEYNELMQLQREYPAEQGWTGHSANAIRIDEKRLTNT